MIAPPGLGRRLRGLADPLVSAAGAVPGADRYRKRFPARAHLWILLDHVLAGGDSLRQTHARLETGGWAGLGLPDGISLSQLARSSTSRSPDPAAHLLAALVARARRAADRAARADPAWAALRNVQLVDSTFVALSAALSPWAVRGKHPAGVRVHTGLDLAGGIPASLVVTTPRTHDAAAFDDRDWGALRGWTVVFDRAYYGHARFAALREAGVSFVCRLNPQATQTVTATRPVDPTPSPAGDALLTDATVTLGTPANPASTVVPGLRVVTYRTAKGETHGLVTDRFDLSAGEVVALYRQRWAIELFFRWLKRQLKALRPLGRSEAAVTLGIVVAAAAALLVMLLDEERPPGVSRVAFTRGVAVLLLPPPATGPG